MRLTQMCGKNMQCDVDTLGNKSFTIVDLTMPQFAQTSLLHMLQRYRIVKKTNKQNLYCKRVQTLAVSSIFNGETFHFLSMQMW